MTHFVDRIHRAASAILATFEALHRSQFSAPWAKPRPRQG